MLDAGLNGSSLKFFFFPVFLLSHTSSSFQLAFLFSPLYLFLKGFCTASSSLVLFFFGISNPRIVCKILPPLPGHTGQALKSDGFLFGNCTWCSAHPGTGSLSPAALSPQPVLFDECQLVSFVKSPLTAMLLGFQPYLIRPEIHVKSPNSSNSLHFWTVHQNRKPVSIGIAGHFQAL